VDRQTSGWENTNSFDLLLEQSLCKLQQSLNIGKVADQADGDAHRA